MTQETYEKEILKTMSKLAQAKAEDPFVMRNIGSRKDDLTGAVVVTAVYVAHPDHEAAAEASAKHLIEALHHDADRFGWSWSRYRRGEYSGYPVIEFDIPDTASALMELNKRLTKIVKDKALTMTKAFVTQYQQQIVPLLSDKTEKAVNDKVAASIAQSLGVSTEPAKAQTHPAQR